MFMTVASSLIMFILIVFLSIRKRTMVAMATYIFHRPILGKMEINKCFVCLFLSKLEYLEFLKKNTFFRNRCIGFVVMGTNQLKQWM